MSLILSFLCSIVSQYTSSRNHSRQGAFLRALQKPPDPAATDDERLDWEQARCFDRRFQRYGRLTRHLNVAGGLFLTVGLALLAALSYLNAPFGKPPCETSGNL